MVHTYQQLTDTNATAFIYEFQIITRTSYTKINRFESNTKEVKVKSLWKNKKGGRGCVVVTDSG